MKITNRWLRLIRFHQPVGVYLLLWPALLALVDASLMTNLTLPPPWLWVLFLLGALCTRSAGCIANDLWDRNIDGHVVRTRNRPIATGEIKPAAALKLMLLLFTLSAIAASLADPKVLLIGIIAIPLIVLYPLAKRITGHPQVLLALTFSMGVPMGYAVFDKLFDLAWLPLMLANMAWIYAYDTIYAMADKPDDISLGIGSSALSWGKYDWLAVAIFQGITISLLGWWWYSNIQQPLVAVAIGIVALGFVWQQWYIRTATIDRCILAFRSNHWLQAIILLALLTAHLFTLYS